MFFVPASTQPQWANHGGNLRRLSQITTSQVVRAQGHYRDRHLSSDKPTLILHFTGKALELHLLPFGDGYGEAATGSHAHKFDIISDSGNSESEGGDDEHERGSTRQRIRRELASMGGIGGMRHEDVDTEMSDLDTECDGCAALCLLCHFLISSLAHSVRSSIFT